MKKKESGKQRESTSTNLVTIFKDFVFFQLNLLFEVDPAAAFVNSRNLLR